MVKTTCEGAIELLPWFLNGSLDGPERRRVEEHLDTCESCRRELADTRLAFTLYGEHLPVEAILGLAESPAGAGWPAGSGTVSREAAAEHLAGCPRCRGDLDLARASRADLDTPGDAAGGAADAPASFAAAAERRRRSASWRGLALAASLTLLVVAAGGWLHSRGVAASRAGRIAELERALATTPAPGTPASELATLEREAAVAAARAAELEERLGRTAGELERAGERLAALETARRGLRHGATVSFLVGSDVLRGGDDPPTVPAEAGEAVFFLDLSTVAEEGPFRAAVLDPRGRVLVERGGLAAVTGGLGRQLTVIVPIADLPDGPLVLRLAAGGRELGRFPFRKAR